MSNKRYTYVQLLPGTAPGRLQAKLDEMVDRYVAPQSIYARFAPGDPSAALAQLEMQWVEANPSHPVPFP